MNVSKHTDGHPACATTDEKTRSTCLCIHHDTCQRRRRLLKRRESGCTQRTHECAARIFTVRRCSLQYTCDCCVTWIESSCLTERDVVCLLKGKNDSKLSGLKTD